MALLRARIAYDFYQLLEVGLIVLKSETLYSNSLTSLEFCLTMVVAAMQLLAAKSNN